MDNQQIQLVQSSFLKIVPESFLASQFFYQELFRLAPQVKPLFKDDMDTQGAKLMHMLGRVVESLYEFDNLQQEVLALGRRHVAYGVDPTQYQYVKQALLSMLKRQLKSEFTVEVEQAWSAIFDQLQACMLVAYRDETSASKD